jgi:hypothetical protein
MLPSGAGWDNPTYSTILVNFCIILYSNLMDKSAQGVRIPYTSQPIWRFVLKKDIIKRWKGQF